MIIENAVNLLSCMIVFRCAIILGERVLQSVGAFNDGTPTKCGRMHQAKSSRRRRFGSECCKPSTMGLGMAEKRESAGLDNKMRRQVTEVWS